VSPAYLITVARDPPHTDHHRGQYIDIPRMYADSEDEALGYAIRLLTECFGLPIDSTAHVISTVIPSSTAETNMPNAKTATSYPIARC
jgi:hypothetical protein